MPDALTVGAVVANAAIGAPDATAAMIGGQRHTFAELDIAGTVVAQQLIAHGLDTGQAVLVVSETSFDLLAAFVGCARAGLVFAPINPGLGHEVVAATAERIGVAAALVSEHCKPRATSLAAPSMWFPASGAEAPHQPLPHVGSADPHIAFFTSGSTGEPKAALLSHRTSVLRSHPGSQLEPRGPALCPYPLFHMGGWTITMQQWHARSAVVFVDGTDAETLVAALRTHNIERFNAIPALWTRLSEHLGADAAGAFPELRFADTGTSPTSVALLDSIVHMAPNAHVRVFYGSTEAGNVTSLHHDDLLRVPGSCGRASVLTTVAIGDDDELVISGPLLFEGYLNDPDATSAVLSEGWYRTGDRAAIDQEGYVHIIGRLGTLIRSGGETIVPATVEQAALTHEHIDEIAVFGIPDEQWGEIVVAAVVSQGAVDGQELRRHLEEAGLPTYAHPRAVLDLAALPLTAATGQVDLHKLRELAKNP